jgi:hypothetical protein
MRLAAAACLRTRHSIFVHSGQGYDLKLLPIDDAHALLNLSIFFCNAQIASMIPVNGYEEIAEGGITDDPDRMAEVSKALKLSGLLRRAFFILKPSGRGNR